MRRQNVKNLKFSMNKAVSARLFLKDWFDYVIKKEMDHSNYKPVKNHESFLEAYDKGEIYCQQLNNKDPNINEFLTICLDYKTIDDGDIRFYYIIKNYVKSTPEGLKHRLELIPYMVYVYGDDTYEDPWGVVERMNKFYYVD